MKRNLWTNTFIPLLRKSFKEDFKSSRAKGTSKNYRLLTNGGFIRSITDCQGFFHLLPLAVRCVDKIEKVIDNVMLKYGCEKVSIPLLTPRSLWNKSGRLHGKENDSEDIMQLIDRKGSSLVLGPTYEESICDLLSTFSLSYKSLPLRFYQMGEKHRDEISPCYGLIRARQFRMKDLYTFDVDREHAESSYTNISCEAYPEIFRNLGLSSSFVRVESCVEDGGKSNFMGSSVSHEFHMFPSKYVSEFIGQDFLMVCDECSFSKLVKNFEKFDIDKCPNCDGKISKSNIKDSIEVGHTFFLNDKYSKRLNAAYTAKQTSDLKFAQMNCFGIGITRLIGATLESFASTDCMRWPVQMAPYKCCIIAPKYGSKEGNVIDQNFIANFHDSLMTNSELLKDDVIIDDRPDMTVGLKLRDAKQLGFPYIILFGKRCIDKLNPQVEVYKTCIESGNTEMNLFSFDAAKYFIQSDVRDMCCDGFM